MNKILHGDCLDVMKTLPENSVDSIVTDPPYGLSFMGKHWDHGVPGVDFWVEALRVLKPGGHLLAFGGSRTAHRLTSAIEDAGFEIRDTIMWLYGSGFPKSLDVSKAIDKAAGAEREVVGFDAAAAKRTPGVGTSAYGDYLGQSGDITAPSTAAAHQWQGWGTALKPAHEPIALARKPLIGTVAANVLAHGTGALNIDGCRVATEENLGGGVYALSRQESTSEWAASGSLHKTTGLAFEQPTGRWPANLIHDGSDEVLAGFPASSVTGARTEFSRGAAATGTRWLSDNHKSTEYIDTGSAARFFYCPKASKKDRDEGLHDNAGPSGRTIKPRHGDRHVSRKNNHPTVKPTDLMRYLCRLVTPPGGTVLDPFTGSGSTGKAAVLEGFHFIGIEREQEYVEIARARIAAASTPTWMADLL